MAAILYPRTDEDGVSVEARTLRILGITGQTHPLHCPGSYLGNTPASGEVARYRKPGHVAAGE